MKYIEIMIEEFKRVRRLVTNAIINEQLQTFRTLMAYHERLRAALRYQLGRDGVDEIIAEASR